MDIHQAMQAYQGVIRYLKEPAMLYVMTQNYGIADRRDVEKLALRLIGLIDFAEAYMAIHAEKKPAELIIEEQLAKHAAAWREEVRKFAGAA